MTTADVDLTLVFRRKHTPPPSVLLLTLPSEALNSERRHPLAPPALVRSETEKPHRRRAPPAFVGFQVHEPLTSSSLSWQRHSEKITRINAAPDVAYRNTYLDEGKRESHSPLYRSRSPTSPLLHSAAGQSPSSSSRSVYNYIRQIERERKNKQSTIAVRVQRPQNEDSTLRRILAEKKSSARSRTSLMTMSTSPSSVSAFNQELKSPQSFVNYINYSRIFSSPEQH